MIFSNDHYLDLVFNNIQGIHTFLHKIHDPAKQRNPTLKTPPLSQRALSPNCICIGQKDNKIYIYIYIYTYKIASTLETYLPWWGSGRSGKRDPNITWHVYMMRHMGSFYFYFFDNGDTRDHNSTFGSQFVRFTGCDVKYHNRNPHLLTAWWKRGD